MTAIISDCGLYRYSLTRELLHWDAHDAGRLLFVMLNPSTGDANTDDNTIKRCKHFAREHGFSSLEIVNLYAYRTPSPLALKQAGYPIGPDNDKHVRAAIKRANAICCAWGAGATDDAIDLFLSAWRWDASPFSKPLKCLGLTKGGHPRHPLYLSGDAKLQVMP